MDNVSDAPTYLGVLVAWQVMYATLRKPSGIAPAIETLTSPATPTVRPPAIR